MPTTNCKNCGKEFSRKLDHGRMPAYCGRDCFVNRNTDNPPKEINCKHCRKLFKSCFKLDKGQYRIFCSKACYTDHSRHIALCKHCEKLFHIPKSFLKRESTKGIYCSTKCFGADHTQEKSVNYKNGKYFSTYTGFNYVAIDKGKYLAEHRANIAKEIGYYLKRDEPVLHINGLQTDNRLKNLYICRDLSEMGYILNSYTVPYPVKSNVNEYKNDMRSTT